MLSGSGSVEQPIQQSEFLGDYGRGVTLVAGAQWVKGHKQGKILLSRPRLSQLQAHGFPSENGIK